MAASRPDLENNRTTSSTGRGGAGNIAPRAGGAGQDTTDLETPTIKQSTYTTGRGGSGNMASNTNPDTARAAQDVIAPAHHSKDPSGHFHWGRGGEGNMTFVGDGERAKSKERTVSKSGERRPSLGGLVEKGKEFLGLNKKKEPASRANEVAIE